MFGRQAAIAALLCVFSACSESRAGEQFVLTDDAEVDGETLFASQPGTGTGDEAARPAAPRSSRSSARIAYAKLNRAPNMFGDSFGNAGQLSEQPLLSVPVNPGNVIRFKGNGNFVDLPLAGGRGFKVAENNKALPLDRFSFLFNGVQNGVTFGAPVPGDANVNRFTLGLEKTFLDGQWSINASMPFLNSLALNSDAFTLNSGSVGNLGLFLKRLMYRDEDYAISAGLGVRLPTGSDLEGEIHQLNQLTGLVDRQTLILQNESVHIVPYLGFLASPGEDWFFQGFFDLDFAANGNGVLLGNPANYVGTYNEQNQMHIDLSAGRWIYQDLGSYVSGVALVSELHYTTTIQDTDRLVLPTNPLTGPFANGDIQNLANRVHVLNATAGLHFQIGNLSNLRVGYVFPLRNQPNRQFDSEIQVSFNRYF